MASRTDAPARRDHAALVRFIESRMRAPFAWGANDCVTFALDAVKAQTGADLRPKLGCTWTSARGAARALGARGGLKAATDEVLRRVARAKALRGDIGLAVVDGREFLVVIEGDLVCAPGERGLVRLQRSALAAAWSLDGAPYRWWR